MNTNESSIRNWNPEDKPREKLLLKGPSALSDAELIAILLGTGSGKETALDLARNILQMAGNHLMTLARLNAEELKSIPGIGDAKALTLMAALELGRRKSSSELNADEQINRSEQLFRLLSPNLSDLSHEEFWAVYLTRNNRIIRAKCVGQGGWSATIADPKIIFKHALDFRASGLVLAHNHPSGNINPSQHDRNLTRRLKSAAEFLDITLLDHIIIAGNRHYSFADNGELC
jgi:DNA repair protein RadC